MRVDFSEMAVELIQVAQLSARVGGWESLQQCIITLITFSDESDLHSNED